MEEVARHYGSFDVLAAVSRDRLLAVLQMGREEPQPKLGLHLPLGETAPAKFPNIGRNLVEGRISALQGVLKKSVNRWIAR